MEGKRFIRTVRLDSILSYGPASSEFPLEPLNVLIGPNASGKSNLLDVLSILQAAPRNLPVPIRRGGGTTEWLWKGRDPLQPATVEVTVENIVGAVPLRYLLTFTQVGHRFHLLEERIEDEAPLTEHNKLESYYRYQRGESIINVKDDRVGMRYEGTIPQRDTSPEESILSQRRNPDSYPELTYLAEQFERIGLYREWRLGPDAPYRLPQRADLPRGRLIENGTNLGLVINHLTNRSPLKRELLEHLRVFYPYIEDIHTAIVGGAVEIFFHERSLQHPIPAARMSDGSLRYLSLLAVLRHPKPHLVTCIEEPEVGLHPDIIPEIAKLLIEASSRSQIIVTTHSDVLVDALTHIPESVIVCEKREAATHLRRLDRGTLKSWLERYRLGELWSKGEIGGNRW